MPAHLVTTLVPKSKLVTFDVTWSTGFLAKQTESVKFAVPYLALRPGLSLPNDDKVIELTCAAHENMVLVGDKKAKADKGRHKGFGKGGTGGGAVDVSKEPKYKHCQHLFK